MKLLLINAFVVVTSPFLSPDAYALNCFGTEPFWSANVQGDSINLDFISVKSTFAISRVSSPAGMPNSAGSFVKVYSDNRGPVAAVISQPCNDGMSDKTYPKEIVLFTGEMTLYGCCTNEGR